MTEAEPDTVTVDQGTGTVTSPTSVTPPTRVSSDPQTFTLAGRDGREVTFRGRRLSTANSRQERHEHRTHDLDDRFIFAPKGWRCGACRWFEVTIYAVDGSVALDAPPNAVYMVHTVGRSIVPDEIDLARTAWADTADKVIELLVQKRHGRPILPESSAIAIEDAADLDDDLNRAYDHWSAAGVG